MINLDSQALRNDFDIISHNQSDKGREVGKDYTHTVSVLVEYEVGRMNFFKWHQNARQEIMIFQYLFYRAWCKDINAVKIRLNSPLLCREDRLREIQVNLDSKILKVLSETKHLRKLNLEVPEFALTLSHVEGRLRRTKERWDVFVRSASSTRLIYYVILKQVF